MGTKQALEDLEALIYSKNSDTSSHVTQKKRKKNMKKIISHFYMQKTFFHFSKNSLKLENAIPSQQFLIFFDLF